MFWILFIMAFGRLIVKLAFSCRRKVETEEMWKVLRQKPINLSLSSKCNCHCCDKTKTHKKYTLLAHSIYSLIFFGLSDPDVLYEVPVGFVILLSIFYGSISIIAVIGNSLVIWIVATTRQMQSVTNLFIANLALADVIIGMFAIPFQVRKLRMIYFYLRIANRKNGDSESI